MENTARTQYVSNLLIIIVILLTSGCVNSSSIGESEVTIYDHSDSAGLLFEITLDEQRYHVHDEIKVKMRLENVGSSPILVNSNIVISGYEPDEETTVYFEIKNPSGIILPFDNIIRWVRTEPFEFILLNPNEEVILMGRLDGYYDLDEIGLYTIKAIYRNTIDHPDGRPAWKGTVESNVTTWEITS